MFRRDKCIRYYLPVAIDTKNDILNKIETHSLYGFAFYRKRLWLKEYKTGVLNEIVMCVIVARKVLCTKIAK